MSSSHAKKDREFVQRFTEVCNSDKPTVIANLLNISYQAAKNYINGRCPDSKTLLIISEKTSYSVHWLLTGKGEKFVNQSEISKSDLFVDRFKGVVDQRFLKAFEAFFEEFTGQKRHTPATSPKTITLTLDKIREQKVEEEEKDFTDLPINPS